MTDQRRQNKAHRTVAMLLFVTSLAPMGVRADGLGQAFVEGDASVNLRYRYEHVSDDRFGEDADASTLRLRLTYATKADLPWQLVTEFDYVAEVGADDFNAAAGNTPSRTQFPVIADPDGEDLNQIYIQRKWDNNGHFRIGRQRILLDNQRFVGGVGWRQNEQTFDALGFSTPLGPMTLSYAYLDNVNRIFGDDVPAGDHEHSSHLLEVQWPIGEGRLDGQAFLLDNEDAPGLSSDTLGLTWTQKLKLGDRPLAIRLQYARQRDAADNPADIDADYWRVDARLAINDRFGAGLGYELLGADEDAGVAFTTSLATLHAFNGWADVFLATPSTGLTDVFGSIDGKLGPTSWKAVYHDFESDVGSDSLGSELDASIGWKFGADKRYSALLKAARFNGDGSRADVSKFWVMFGAAF